MENNGYSRQENYFSPIEGNTGIIQGNNFSGTVVDALQNAPPSGHDVEDIVWGEHRVSQDAVDGAVVSHGGTSPILRSGVPRHGTSEMISPMQRSQERMSAERSAPPVFITVRRRNILDDVGGTIGLSEREKEILLRERRAALVREYSDITDPTLQRLLALCAPLLNIAVGMEKKYAELDIWRVLEANQEKSHFLHLTQGLGILEKYASNLTKEGRPPYWRTVKFTSSLIQVHVGRLIGSRDILSQIGYTQDIPDGVAFPADVPEPNVDRLKNLAPDLFFARYEIDALLVNNHPFYELDPPLDRNEVELPVLMQVDFPPSRPQPFPPRESSALPRLSQAVVASARPPAMQSSGRGDQPGRPSSSPVPTARRQAGREPLSPPEGKESQTITQSNLEPADRNNESEGDSEYEDAEDGILPSNDSSVVQTNFECRVCGESTATKFCKDCKDTFCAPCNDLYHKHPSRQRHVRTELLTPTAGPPREQAVVGAIPAAGAVGATIAARTRLSASGTEQQPIRAASPVISTASAGLESRSRPVPAPRRNKTPRQTGTTCAPEPKREEDRPLSSHPKSPDIAPWKQPHSASPSVRGVSQLTATSSPTVVASTVAFPPSVAGGQSVASQPVTSRSSQAHSQEREILRPPPFEKSFSATTGQHISGAKDERENKSVLKSSPASAVPLKQASTAKPKVPVESRAASQEPTISAAQSCPLCYFLNSGDAKICLFCNKPLPVKTQRETSEQSVQRRHGDHPETGLVSPSPWPPPEQQMQQPQGNSVASSGAAIDPDKWECQYCTYHNPRTRRICEMCFKTGNNFHLPARSSEFPGSQQNTQNVTNMVMQGSFQQVRAVTETLKKTDSENLQAAPKEIPAKPAQVNKSSRPWEDTGSVPQDTPPEPHMTRAFQGLGISEQPGILNTSGVVCHEMPARSSFPVMAGFNPGGMATIPEVPVRNPVMRGGAGLPLNQQEFPVPSPMIQSGGVVGPEIPTAGPFTAPTPFLQQPFSPGFPQAPPPLATTWTGFPDEALRRQQEEIYIAGSCYVEWLRKAEKEGFTAEELNIASVLAIDDPEGPIHWLHTAWYDLIHKVMVELAVPENSQEIGNISPEEVREALIDCTGEVSRATAKCMELRKKKVKELQQAGVYAKTDCVCALDTCAGDTAKAVLSLEKMAMRPMLQRVLNSCLPDHATQDEVFRVLTKQIDTQSPQDKANFEAIVKDKAQNVDRRIRAVLAEKNVGSWGRAETAIKLIDMNYSVEDSVEAACNCGDMQRSLRYLQQECPVCTEKRPMSQMVTFLHCQDRVCQECVSQYITVTIKDKNILHLVCPVCSKPENLDDEAVATEYFNNFDIMIRGLVDQETHDLFQRKLRDRTLMKEPNFRWCSHCSSGFINEQPGHLKMMCPHCRQYTCFKCKRQWEDQHQGISCEQFAAWKEANDPEFQAAGLAAHLKLNGIVCPSCKYRYDLSKGGCMHFKCAMCPHEFCSGCYNPFVNPQNQNCRISEQCLVRGLHAHHPRDCYFYLRDRGPEELQRLLNDNNVAYNTEPPEGQGNASSDEEDRLQVLEAAAAAPLHCKVSEQKESDHGGLMDAECGAEAPAGYAGLCGKHYVEYLVVLVNDNLLDPAEIMSCDDLKRVLERGFVAPPVKPNRMTDDQYRQLLLQTVKEQLFLPPKSPRKRILDDDEDDIYVEPNVETDDDSEEEDDDFEYGNDRDDAIFN